MTQDAQARPKLHAFRRERGVSQKRAAEVLRVSQPQIGRYELPFADPQRQIPSPDVLGRIVAWTNGEVTAADFYPPELNGQGARLEGATP